jgi:phosphate-selective porin
MKRFSMKAVILAGLLLSPATALAGSMDGLGDLLVEKGVISKDDLKAQQKKKWLNVEGRIQARYTWAENDEPKDNTSEFTLPRVRFGAAGALAENVNYKLEIDFVPSSSTNAEGNVSGGTSVALKDAKVNFTHFEYVPITVGHFKVPFSRQELTSSGNQQFVNRAAINAQAQTRDVGFMLGDYLGKQMVEYAIGAFNGTKTANKNDNTGFLIAARAAVNPFGEFKYSESNLEGESLRASLGVNVQTNKLSTAGPDTTLLTDDDVDTDTTKYGVDLGVKFLDNASIFAEYIKAKFEPDGGTEFDADGFYVQGGYFILPPHFEVTARYEQYDPNDTVDNTSDIKWTTVGLNYFWKKHDWKLQANYVMKDEEEDPASGETKDDDTFLLQLQVKF